MIRSMLEHIDGIATYPIISLVLFFAFFVGMTIFVFRMDKTELETMKKLPLDSESGTLNKGDEKND